MFSWKDLLIVGLELLAIATLVKSTFAQSRSPIVMFCGPSQASTLLSKAMLKGLSLRAPKFLKKSCPPEFFNPSCSLKVRNSKTLAFCFGSNGFHDNMWKVCTSERFEDVLNLARENGFMFAKENFGNGFQLQYLNQNNFTTFIAFRSAKHTFPTPGSKWYLDIWKSLMRTSRKDLLQLPSGSSLVLLRDHATKLISNNPYGFQRECIAHFLHFWQLLAVALKDMIPVINIDRLLLVKTRADALNELQDAGVCSLDGLEEGRCEVFAAAVFNFSKKPVHLHTGVHFQHEFSTSELFKRRESEYQRKTKCDEVLQQLMSFCKLYIRDCSSILEIYTDGETNFRPKKGQ